MTIIARHLLISGRVQGVFYRGWTVETATGLGLTGWVRNLRNGDVEALVQGPVEVVERFIEMAHAGPRAARVQGVEASVAPVGFLHGFEQRASD
ncbi:MAG: acylphosphatase [Sphingobium sp.]|nr:acylphosphatase [Sphingobium sp.]